MQLIKSYKIRLVNDIYDKLYHDIPIHYRKQILCGLKKCSISLLELLKQRL